jgi:hypothetical protein
MGIMDKNTRTGIILVIVLVVVIAIFEMSAMGIPPFSRSSGEYTCREIITGLTSQEGKLFFNDQTCEYRLESTGDTPFTLIPVKERQGIPTNEKPRQLDMESKLIFESGCNTINDDAFKDSLGLVNKKIFMSLDGNIYQCKKVSPI